MPHFLRNSNIYEVNLRQYSYEGSIKAFMQQLPGLHDMGVEILWFMPIHPIGNTRRKGTLGSYYSIKDFCDINPEFGSKEDFKALVEAVHGFGMKIIIDWVANHAAWDNVWTISNPDFFVRDDSGNFKPPYDWDDVIQFDHSSAAQQEAMTNAMKYWITEFDIDGFRADLAHLTPLPFWINARNVMSALKTDLIWLAETEEVHYYEAFNIIYAWKWMHATEQFIKNGTGINSLIELLEKQKHELPEGALQMYFTTNHDENSWNGTEYEKYGAYAKALAVFNYTFCNSVPLIYSGQELPNLKRLKFFDKDLIEWTGKEALHDFYKKLNAFHKNDFTGGTLEFIHFQKNVFAFSRKHAEREVLVFLNFDKEVCEIDLNNAGNYQDVFSGTELSATTNKKILLEPGGYMILKK